MLYDIGDNGLQQGVLETGLLGEQELLALEAHLNAVVKPGVIHADGQGLDVRKIQCLQDLFAGPVGSAGCFGSKQKMLGTVLDLQRQCGQPIVAAPNTGIEPDSAAVALQKRR